MRREEVSLVFGGTGFVGDNLYVTGFAWSPVYLFAGSKAALFEAGFYCMGRLYEMDIRQVLKDENPVFLFLTHVHYDHCGAAAYLKRAFPGLKIAASRRAAEIVKRPNARQLMGTLSENVIRLIDEMEGINRDMLIREPFEPFDIDYVLDGGETIILGSDFTVKVFATPGHTRDMLSYYIPERKILIVTEAAGVLGQGGRIVTEFLVDCDAYLASLRQLALLDVKILCQGHHFVFVGDDVKAFLTESIEGTEQFMNRVEELLDSENGSIDRVVAIIKKEEYDTNPGIKQPEKAYLLNLRTRVIHIAERLQQRPGWHIWSDSKDSPS
jgi:glyoxylase-like metal-dependent hydrolase (beta-lactamase superfamily II)